MEHNDQEASLGRVIEKHLFIRPFVWGQNDCAYAIANIHAEAFGDTRMFDALSARYKDRRGGLTWISAGGGLGAVSAELACEIGYREVFEPVQGDVGIVEGQLGLSMAIYYKQRFWAKGILNGATGLSRANTIWRM